MVDELHQTEGGTKMPIVLKALVLLGGLTGLLSGMAMLLLFERFMAFNDYLNKNIFRNKNYDWHQYGWERYLFTMSYLTAVFLIGAGCYLLYVFSQYFPY
ncbi:MAG: hypothetical protein MUC35_04695 [Candidatus Margulisbacteria bacterium]|nr:hypothetical protein [Candidatus Margulisiibacteriota bacterium]